VELVPAQADIWLAMKSCRLTAPLQNPTLKDTPPFRHSNHLAALCVRNKGIFFMIALMLGFNLRTHAVDTDEDALFGYGMNN